MKKILFLFLQFLSIAVYAQTGQGSFMIGGSGTISFNKNDWSGQSNTEQTTLNLSPDAGYFLEKNLSVGLYLPFEVSKSKTTYTPGDDSHAGSYSIGVAPFVRYYIPVKSFFVITEGSFGWWYSKNTWDYFDPSTGVLTGEQEYTTRYKSFSLATGPAFFLSPHTSIELLFNYQRAYFEEMDQSTFFLSIGFQIYLPSKKQ